MHVAECQLKTKDPHGSFPVFAIGDLHADSKGFDEDRCKAWVAHIAEHGKSGAIAICVGDYLNGQTPGHKHFEPEATRQDYLINMDGYVKHSLAHVERLLRPLQKAGVHTYFVEGNHDRMIGAVGYTAMISDRLGGTFLGGAGFVQVRSGGAHRFTNNSLYPTTIYAHHGSKGGGTPGPKVNAMHALMGWADADLYVAGHVHDGDCRVVPRYGVTSRTDTLVLKKRDVGLYRAPSFIERAGAGFTTYADRKEYGTNDEGLMWMEVVPRHQKIWRHEFQLYREAA